MPHDKQTSSEFIARVRDIMSQQPFTLPEPTLVTVDEAWLREQGVTPDDPEESEDLTAKAYNRIWARFESLMRGELPLEKIEEYDHIGDAIPSDGVCLAWLKVYFPDYAALAERAREDMGQDIQAATYKKQMVAGWSKPAQPKVTYTGTLDEAQIKAWGVTADDEDMKRLFAKFMTELKHRVGTTLAEIMTDRQLDEFEAVQQDQDKALKWLKENMPYYSAIVAAEAKRLGAEIDESTDKRAVIEGWGQEVSERLQDFLTNWCNPDTSPDEVEDMLHGKSGSYYHDWLEKELLAAADAGGLTPEFMGKLANRYFEDQQAVDARLQEVWPKWFDRPYPGKANTEAPITRGYMRKRSRTPDK